MNELYYEMRTCRIEGPVDRERREIGAGKMIESSFEPADKVEAA